MALSIKSIDPQPHHEQSKMCATRPAYRQGRNNTAVKVYTINQESQFLLIIGVPAVGAKAELNALCGKYGETTMLEPADDYPCDPFTEVYLVHYDKLQSARYAKRKLDGYSFFGGVLHVCYAPECESLEQTRNKLMDRQKYINIVTKSGYYTPWSCRKVHKNAVSSSSAADFPSGASTTQTTSHDERSENLHQTSSITQMTYIWAGQTYTVDPSDALKSDSPGAGDDSEQNKFASAQPVNPLRHFIPRQLTSKRKVEVSSEGQQPNDNYEETSTSIRAKLSKVREPQLDVRFKKKSTI